MGCLLHQSPQFYNKVFLFVSLTTFGTLLNFDWLAQYVQFYLRGNFVYYHWRFTPIYRPLSYPFRYLSFIHLLMASYYRQLSADSIILRTGSNPADIKRLCAYLQGCQGCSGACLGLQGRQILNLNKNSIIDSFSADIIRIV